MGGLAVPDKVHAILKDVNDELTMTDEIQDREEIGAKLRDMQHSSELDLAHSLALYLWSEHN